MSDLVLKSVDDINRQCRRDTLLRAPKLTSKQARELTIWREVNDAHGNPIPTRTPDVKVKKNAAGPAIPDVSGQVIHDARPKSLGKVSGTDKVQSASSNKNFQNKVAAETDIANNYWGYRGILQPEYNLLEPYTLLDVEGIFLNALKRMHALSFRNGVEWVAEKEANVKYIKKRTEVLGYVMGTTFEQHLKEVLWHLLICSNCIVVKIRDTSKSGGTANAKNGNKVPVAGYTIVPPQTIFPYMDGFGQIAWWRRFYKDGRPYRDYLPEDIVHYRWDVKPGHLFGCPRVYSVRDDIYALRRLEENAELLLMRHLFPLFHIKVGSDAFLVEFLPDGSSELDAVRMAIQNMPKEGVLVTEHRVEVDVHGAEGKGIDPHPLIDHYKSRVYIGLGVSSIDVGEGDTANHSTADNVSQNLKDRVKADMATFGSMVKMNVVKEMFEEHPDEKISVQNAVADVSLATHEIDVDAQIKLETHAANMYNTGIHTRTEARKQARKNPLTKEQESDLHFNAETMTQEKFRAKTQKELLQMKNEATSKVAMHSALVEHGGTKTTHVKKGNSKTGTSQSRMVKEPTEHGRRLLSNLVQPENQHGKNLDPHKAKSSEDPALAQAITDRLLEAHEALVAADELTLEHWQEEVEKILAELIPDNSALQVKARSASLLGIDGDLLPSLLAAALSL